MPNAVSIVKTPRLLRRFESISGAITWKPPLIGYEWESEQALIAPEATAIGMDFSYDLLGLAEARQTSALERLRFAFHARCEPSQLDTYFGDMRSKLLEMGLGKGWTLDSNGLERWSYLRLVEMPSYRVIAIDAPGTAKLLAVTALFRRHSAWLGENLDDGGGPFTINSQPETFNVTNPGQLRVMDAVITLKGTWAIGTTITNTTNDYEMQTLRAGSSVNHWLRFSCGQPAVEFSSNAGVTWAPDYLNYVRKPGQVQLMRLERGINAFSVDAGVAPNATLEFSFRPRFPS